MKAEFKKSQRHPKFYLLCLLYVFCLVDIILLGSGARVFGFMMLLAVALPITPQYLGTYTVTDDDILKGNGTVYIQNINKLVFQKDRVDMYYLDTNTGKTRIKNYFPQDKDAFVNKLKEINKDIQIV